jgi:beta-glucanase (GH16 family)
MTSGIFNIKTMKAVIAAVSLLLSGCDISTEPKSIEDKVPSDNYVLVWADEFDQDSQSPNPDYWNYETGYGSWGWGNDEWQLYTSSQENIRIEDGKMVISALCPSGVPGKRDGSVTSARVTTKNKYDIKYGKIEARIKLPGGMGTWPAFWMLGKNIDTVGWPACGEIDIMEGSPHLLGRNTTSCAIHWDDGGHNYVSDKLELSSPLDEDYHVYEVEWSQQRIVGRIDGMTYFVKAIDPSTMSEFYNKFFLILNIAVGGHMGGAPDETTVWPQNMYIDWIRAYQLKSVEIERFGIFTDTTPVDDRITPGLNAEIYVWEETLTAASIPPYEGTNVMSFATTGKGWFGGGIMSNWPIDLSAFENGYIFFMIKIPADVTFEIGLIDSRNVQKYVAFPAAQTTYGLERNGDWGRAVIPVQEIKGSLDLEMLNYSFVFLERNGTPCEFAIDDIYWSLTPPWATISLSEWTYALGSTSGEITVNDPPKANTTVSVSVSNGTETINLNVVLNSRGSGTGTFTFGATSDSADRIEFIENGILTVAYTDASGETITATSYTVGTSTEPVSAAPLPPHDASNVKSIFSGAYTNITGVNYFPDWGQQTEGSIVEISGDEVLLYQNLNYQGIDWSTNRQNVSAMGYLHLDFWTANSTSLSVYLVSTGPKEKQYVLNVRPQTWVSVDIPISYFQSSVDLRFTIQLKLEGNGDVWMDNIYFWSEQAK